MDPKPIAAALAAVVLSACVAPVPYNERVEKSAAYQSLNAQLSSEAWPERARLEQLEHLVQLTLTDRILFADGSAQLDDAGKAVLTRVAPALKDLSGKRVVVAGFSDDAPIGTAPQVRFASNVMLSKARAEAVAAFLVAQGVPQGIVFTTGLGETHPVATNATPEGRAANRRVEIDIVAAPA